MAHDLYARHDDLLIPVGGSVVAATRFEPTDSDRDHPVILTYDPYHKDDFTSFVNRYTDIVYFTAHGYEVVVADMVGSGASTGGAKAMFAPDEGVEAATIIDWLADRDWSTGRIGMFGKSYSGITCLKAAAEGPDGLEAIVPEFAPTTYSGIYEGGAVFLYWLLSWVAWMQTWQAMPPTRRDESGRWERVWWERLDDLRAAKPWLFEGLEHQLKDDYWQARDIQVDRIDVPTFAFAGWRDPYHRETIDYIRQIEAPKRLVLGPWRHERPHLGREEAIDERRQIVEWFDRFLKETPNGALDRPTIAYWTEQWDEGRLRSGVWQETDRWPDSNRDSVAGSSFALSQHGLVEGPTDDIATVERTYTFDQTVGMESTDTHTPNAGELDAPLDTSADDARSLCFETTPLEEYYELTGSGTADLRLSTTIEDPMVVVRVIDVGPKGSARLISSGRLRVQCRDGLVKLTPVTPGQVYRLSIPLSPKSHLFEPGHRIRVAVSAALFPLLLPTGEHGSLTVYSTPGAHSRVELPGRRHEEPPEPLDSVGMDNVDDRYPVSSPYLSDSTASLRTSREHLRGRGKFDLATDQTFSTPFLDELRWSNSFDATVAPDDPGSLSARHRSDVAIAYESETVTVESRAQATRDTGELTTTVEADDESLFEETWAWEATTDS